LEASAHALAVTTNDLAPESNGRRRQSRVEHIESELARRDTIVGGAVNLASRLEQEAEPGRIFISFETFAHVRDHVRCEELGYIRGNRWPPMASSR